MSTKNTFDILPGEVLGKANQIIQGLSKEQILWLGGYLSGVGFAGGQNNIEHNSVGDSINTTVKASDKVKLKILVGSHSGNSKKVADVIARLISDNKDEAEIVNMTDYNPRNLSKEENILIIVSTHGEGEPPVAAEDLHKFLDSKRAGDLSKVNFAVVALGDSSYKYFCKTGIDFHERLIKHGANALAEPVLLDTNFSDNLITVAKATYKLFKNSETNATELAVEEVKTTTSENGIYKAEIIEKIQLNGKGSNKETYHIELSLNDSGFTYKPGDALDVYPVNESKLVQSVIKKLGFNINKIININGENTSLLQALSHQREVTVITAQVLKNLAAYTDETGINELLDNHDKLAEFLEGTDLLDLVNKFNFKLSAQQLVDALRPLPPRAYSISSSQSEVGNEVHITVAPVRYNKNDRTHLGAASVYFADRLSVGEKIAVRIKQNEGFRLPNENTPVIMIGPGTGVAPFRAFVQERAANNHKGKNWLFFGDQHFATDFLYQAEWLKYRDKGIINKLDVAFSRDQDEKIYVQHRLKENADEVYKWLDEGACIYVCGDRKHMAADVKNTFVEIIQNKENISKEQATEKLNILRKQNRYQEDVY